MVCFEATADKIIKLKQLFMQKLDRHLEFSLKTQINPSHFFLLSLLEAVGSMSMGEIAKTLVISRQQATQLVDRMIFLGYLKRVENPKDRRVIDVHITENGYEVLNRCQSIIYQDVIKMLSKIDGSVLARIDSVLNDAVKIASEM